MIEEVSNKNDKFFIKSPIFSEQSIIPFISFFSDKDNDEIIMSGLFIREQNQYYIFNDQKGGKFDE